MTNTHESLINYVSSLRNAKRSLFLGFDSGGQPIHSTNEEALLVVGGPGSGKGLGVIAPNVAIHPGSVIVTSFKDDIRSAVWEARKALADQHGGVVKELDFRSSSDAGSRYQLENSPYLSENDLIEWSIVNGFTSDDECRKVVRPFVEAAIRDPHHEHWADAARDLISSYMYAAKALDQQMGQVASSFDDGLLVMRRNGKPITLEDTPQPSAYISVLRFAAEKAQEYRLAGKPMPRFPNGLEISDAPWNRFQKIFQDGIGSPNEVSSFVSFVRRAFSEWDGHSSRGSEVFDVNDLFNGYSTVFITLPQADAKRYAPLVAAFVEHVRNRWCIEHPDMSGTSEPRLLLALDEVAHIAPLPDLSSLITANRGNGIQTIAVLQSPSQARERWGDAGAETIIQSPFNRLLLRGVNDATGYLAEVSTSLGEEISDGKKAINRSASHIDSKNYASPDRLCREREELEKIFSGSDATYQEKRDARRQILGILRRRKEDGIHTRPMFRESGRSRIDSLILEVESLTDIEYTRERLPIVNPSELSSLRSEQGYLLNPDQKTKVDVPYWFNSPHWMALFGHSAYTKVHERPGDSPGLVS